MVMEMLKDFRKKRLRIKGQNLMTRGRIEKASKTFEKLLLIDNSPENQYNYALTLLSCAKYGEAESYLTKVLEVYPNNEIAKVSMAECKLHTEDWQEAVSIMKTLVKEHPTNINYKKYLATMMDSEKRNLHIRVQKLLKHALLKYDNKEFGDAITSLEEAVGLDRENATINYLMGTSIIMDSHDYEKALPYLEIALKASPDNVAYQRIYRMAAQRVARKKKKRLSK